MPPSKSKHCPAPADFRPVRSAGRNRDLGGGTVNSQSGHACPGGGFGGQQLGAGAQRRQRRAGGNHQPVLDKAPASEGLRLHKGSQKQFQVLALLSSELAISQVGSNVRRAPRGRVEPVAADVSRRTFPQLKRSAWHSGYSYARGGRRAHLARTTSMEACSSRSAPVPGRSRLRPARHARKLQDATASGRCCARGRAHSGGTGTIRPRPARPGTNTCSLGRFC